MNTLASSILVAPNGKLLVISKVVVRNGRIAELHSVANADSLAEMEIMELETAGAA